MQAKQTLLKTLTLVLLYNVPFLSTYTNTNNMAEPRGVCILFCICVTVFYEI